MAQQDISSWITLLGGPPFAVGIYKAFSALEDGDIVNPKRREEIVSFLTNPPNHASLPNVGKIVLILFEGVFGKRHLSWRCVGRSILVTLSALCLLGFVFQKHYHLLSAFSKFLSNYKTHVPWADMIMGAIVPFALCSLIPDYLSLWKGRYILGRTVLNHAPGYIIAFAVLDFVVSWALSFIFCVVYADLALSWLFGPANFVDDMVGAAGFVSYKIVEVVGKLAESQPINEMDESSLFLIYFLSTLFTSVWTLVVGGSVIIIRSFLPLTMFSKYMLNVEQHPIRSIGVVVATMFWVGSLIYSFV